MCNMFNEFSSGTADTISNAKCRIETNFLQTSVCGDNYMMHEYNHCRCV